MVEEVIEAAALRFAGFVDDFASSRLHGWAVDRGRPDHAACLAVFAGNRLVGVCRADIVRQDLAALMPGEGRHGFECLLQEAAFDGDGLDVFAISHDVFRRLTGAEASDLDGSASVAWSAFQHAFEGSYDRIPDMNDNSIGLRDLRARLGGTPSKDRAGSAGVVLVEIGDLVAFHRAHVRGTGIQRVLCGLIDALSEMAGADDVEFCLLSQRPGVVNIVDTPSLKQLVSNLLGGGLNREDLDRTLMSLEGTARARRTGAADIVFIAGAFWIHEHLDRGLVRMREQGTRLGLLVHDLIPFTHPHLVSSATRRAFTAPALVALPQFDLVVTTSAFVAGQARSILANEVGRKPAIWTVPLPHLSIAKAFDERPAGEAMRATSSSYPANEPFVLCVCTIEVRKNHMLLYRVWAGLLRKHGAGAVPRLVLVGRWGWDVDEFRRSLETSDYLDGHVIVLSDLGDDALAGLYRRCLFTVFPSFAEGWGLPVGESLVAGKLCIASRATAIPEVGGDLCAYFDPHDVIDAFTAIERPILDRAWLSDRERGIAAAFCPRSWADTSSHLLRGLRDARTAPHPDGAEAGSRRGLVFSAADIIDFTRPLQGDDGMPWRMKGAASVLATGWHPLGTQGARAYARESTIAIATDMEPGAEIAILLRLAGTGRERPCCLRVEAGKDAAVVTIVGKGQRWSELRGVVGPSGVLRIAIAGFSEGAFTPDAGEVAFTLLAIGIFDSAACDLLAAYRRITSLPAMASIAAVV